MVEGKISYADLTSGVEEVQVALARYQREFYATSLAIPTKHTYTRHAKTFPRWLAGEFRLGSGLDGDSRG